MVARRRRLLCDVTVEVVSDAFPAALLTVRARWLVVCLPRAPLAAHLRPGERRLPPTRVRKLRPPFRGLSRVASRHSDLRVTK